MKRRIAVIGDGVAARAILWFLKQENDTSLDTLHFSSEALAPKSSLNSTAVAALRGTQKGLSELGDELVDMWQFTDQFFRENQFQGVTEAKLEHLIFDEKEKRRFAHLSPIETLKLAAKKKPLFAVSEPAWMIAPDLFLKTLPSAAEVYNTLVTSLKKSGEGWLIGTQGNEAYQVDQVILCLGVYSSWFEELLQGSPLEKMKTVQGSYYEWQGEILKSESFALSFQGINLNWRSDLQTLQIGATSIKGDLVFYPQKTALDFILKTFHEFIQMDLPTNPQVKTGHRALTKSRRPWAGELQVNLYALGGLYKNGWVSAWPLAQKLVESLRK